MGGSFGGSSSESKTNTSAFAEDDLMDLISKARAFGSERGQARGFSPQGESLQELFSGGLTGDESASIQEQLRAIDEGQVGAEQNIQQSVRERAAATGFGGSSTALSGIASEAAGLANIPLARAQQRADVFGRAGQLSRQGLLSGLQSQQFGESSRMKELQLGLQALLGAGGLAGTAQTTGSSGSRSLSGSGGLMGS